MENIAVVGIANLFPGSSAPEAFWQQLLEKQDCRSKATDKQMGVAPEKYTGKKGDVDKFYCVHGGYINNFAFDEQPFLTHAKTSSDLNANYLKGLDDLNQWALYVTHQALANAGYWGSEQLANCGVILGNLSFPTKSSNHLFMPLYHKSVEQGVQLALSGNDQQASNFQLTNFVNDHRAQQNIHPDNALVAGFPSALIAKAAGLGGSHFSLDAACASSCYSVKLACDYLHTGKADMMLAGAVSGSDPLFVNMGFSIFQAYPENNVHAPFDSNSQGLFAGEGAGMMVLKRHSDAVHDGDNILAVIRGGALSNDGKGEFVLSPNTKGQVLVYQRAYQDAGVAPSDVDYIECHATGTPKGDKVELGSMETFFSQHNNKPLLGSVKSNLGHLLTAAGMPGMTKAIWALNQQVIPPTINLTQPIRSKDGYLTGEQIPTEITPWPRKPDHAPTAGVSVFGFGGSNAHLVLQGKDTPVDFDQASAKNALASAKQQANEPLSIVGMDAHFGKTESLLAFEQLILNGQSNFVELPKTRWKGIENNTEIMAAMNLKQAPQGGYVENFDIDFLRFKVPPNEQDSLIPQQLMMMKVADNAAKDAKLVEGANVAVIVAMGLELELHQYRGRVNLSSQIEQSLQQQGIELSVEQQQTLTDIAKNGVASAAQLNQYTSFIGNIMASRISALWDFSGPAFTVSAEENSAYRCVELAQSLFATSEVEAVIIAGVDLAGSAENICLRQHYGDVAVEPNTHSSSEQTQAVNTWKVGEGAAAIVVKPQTRVSAQTAESYAQIDALAFSNGLTENAQNSAIDKALSQANIAVGQVGFVEKHGSGFANEQQLEASCLAKFYQSQVVSSVKDQIGHTFNASGMASLISTALRLNAAKVNAGNLAQSFAAINGLGKDDAVCHLVLSGAGNSRTVVAPEMLGATAATLSKKKKPQLIKTITLGGKAIAQSIAENLVACEQFEALKTVLSSELTPVIAKPSGKVAFPIQLSKITRSQTNSSKAKTINQSFGDDVTDLKTSLHSSVSPAGVAVDFPQLNDTHQAFLKQRHNAQQQISELLDLQVALENGQVVTPSEHLVNQSEVTEDRTTAQPVIEKAVEGFAIKGPAGYQYPPLALKQQYSRPNNVVWHTEDLVEFAEGDIAKVFGEEYKIIDSYSRRVRLPTTDYLLVSRVTALDAQVNDYRKSTMVTEYDIPVDAPFLIDGQIPWSVAVESGQCDLLLISYIGIDFQAKGERVYRLLDCELTFLEEMAFGGETLRYEIQIDSYAKNGDQLLFFFHYDCYVGDKKVLIMRNGCAGFFTDEELADGKGVILNDKDKAELANAQKRDFPALLSPQALTQSASNTHPTYNYQDMMKLVGGDVAACFGANYDQQGRNPSLKFSSEKFLMIERITKVERNGGHWGLGIIEGQKDLAPEHWYFPCHFKDDQVMAGSLMSEGCGQLAMFYMLSLGMHSYVNNARFQPMPGEAQTVRCRGQVTPQTNTLTYRMEVTALGMEPQPYLKANITIILDGKPVVDFKNLSVMIVEQTDTSPYPVTLPNNVKLFDGAKISQTASIQQASDSSELDERCVAAFKRTDKPLMWVSSDLSAQPIKGVVPIKHVPAPEVSGQNRTPDTAPFTPWHMFEFATGNISNCFGNEFDIYHGRIPPRTPCGDLQLVTQVVDVQGTRLDLKSPSSCTAEYYVPHDAWYFSKNSHDNWMPYSILMEIALQPNGFISGYMGATLKYPEKDLFFRNLDGSGELIKQIDLRGKTIVNKSVMLSTSMAGGAIIQNFTFELYVKAENGGADELFYKGTAVFGYFSADSLTNQLGIDNGKVTHPWFVNQQTPSSQIEKINLRDTALPYYQAPANKPHYKIAGGQLNFIDQVSVVEGGGDHNIAYLLGERTIDVSDWFFRYHFHQDPVMPGSLGVEAIIELLQTYALKNDLGAALQNPRFIAPATNVKWKYRGQITPENKQMSLDVHIKAVENLAGEVRIIGDANLSKDGLRIYQVSDIVLSIVEA